MDRVLFSTDLDIMYGNEDTRIKFIQEIFDDNDIPENEYDENYSESVTDEYYQEMIDADGIDFEAELFDFCDKNFYKKQIYVIGFKESMGSEIAGASSYKTIEKFIDFLKEEYFDYTFYEYQSELVVKAFDLNDPQLKHYFIVRVITRNGENWVEKCSSIIDKDECKKNIAKVLYNSNILTEKLFFKETLDRGFLAKSPDTPEE